MPWFKKKSPDVIDYSLMQKRGLIKEQKTSLVNAGSSGNSPPSPNFDFLSTLAGAGASSSSSTSVADSLRDARRKSSFNAEISQLKVQHDNLDFKINNLMDKITEINKRLREKGI